MNTQNIRRDKSTNIRTLKLLGAYFRPYKWWAALAIFALTIGAATLLAIPQGVRLMVDEAFKNGSVAQLEHALALLAGLVFVMAVSVYVRTRAFMYVGDRVVADLRKAVYAHLMRLPPVFFETRRTGELISRLTADVAILFTTLDSTLPIALRSGMQLIGGLILLLITSVKLTAVVLLVVPVVLVMTIVFGRRVRGYSRDVQERLADVGAHVERTLNAITTVQAFAQEKHENRIFDDIVEDGVAISLKRNNARAMFFAVVLFSVFMAIGVVLWIGGGNVLAGNMEPGALIAFIIYAIMVAMAVGSLTEVWSSLQLAAGATERLFALLEAENTITDPQKPAALKEARGGREISFEAVTFAYPGRPDIPALKEVSVTIKAGEKVAIVGPSGAGKSTMFGLLLRFYDPQEGHVALDGFSLTHLKKQDVRTSISLVAQEPVVFSASARDNIRYGNPTASDEDVHAAAKLAQADDFIAAMPDGYDTFLGEKGVRLSGGQRQRIAIARTVLTEPDVLLLDEATSNLDAESEQRIQQAFEKLMKNRTTLVIAHRLATVKAADRILVMDKGEIVAQGTHAQLMKNNALYKRLATLQFIDE